MKSRYRVVFTMKSFLLLSVVLAYLTVVDSFHSMNLKLRKTKVQSRDLCTSLHSTFGEEFDEDAFFRGSVDESDAKEESSKKDAYVMQGDFDDDKFFREGLEDTPTGEPVKKPTKKTTAKKAVPKKKAPSKLLSNKKEKEEEKATVSTPVVDDDLIYDDFGDIMDTPPPFSGNTMDQQWLEEEENTSYFDDDSEDTEEKNGGYGKLGSSKLFYTRAELTEAVGGKVAESKTVETVDSRPVAKEPLPSSQSIVKASNRDSRDCRDMEFLTLASKVDELSTTVDTLKLLNAILIGIIIGFGVNYHVW